MRIVRLVIAGALAALLAACFAGPHNSGGHADRDWFAETLAGAWTEVGTDDPATLAIAGHELTRDGATEAYVASEAYGNSRFTVTTDSTEYLFKRLPVGQERFDCLFELDEHSNPARVFVKDEEVASLPEGYVPDIDDDKKVSSGLDYEALKQAFIDETLLGGWTEYGSVNPWHITFGEDGAEWSQPDGESETYEYKVGYANGPVGYVDMWLAPYPISGFEYIQKRVDGNLVRCLFAEEPLSGPGPYPTHWFVKDEDFSALPDGYELELYQDDEPIAGLVPDAPVYVFDDVEQVLDWLGKSAEAAGVDEAYVQDEEVQLAGQLFGSRVQGTARTASHFYTIDLCSYDLTYERVVSKLTDLYGPGAPLSSYQVEGLGMVQGMMYFPSDLVGIAVWSYSDVGYININYGRYELVE